MHSDINEKRKDVSPGLMPIDPDTVAALQASAPSDELIAVVAGTFQALGDPTRLKMLYALVKRSCCVRDLAILVGVSESAVSHQLRFLKDRQLVKQRREGTTIYYSLNDSHLAVFFQEAEQHADHVYHNLPDHPNF